MLFKASISLCNYSTKPNDTELSEMIFCQRELNTHQLSELIQQGFSVCQVFNKINFLSFQKTNNNFKEANFIVLDIDESELTFQYVLDHAIIKPTIAFETFRDSVKGIRFKLIYLLEKPISDKQEYKRLTEMVFNIAFTESDKMELRNALDTTCYSPTFMFHGTKSDKRVKVFDTVISLDLINQTIQTKSTDFISYEEVFDYLNIPFDFKPISNSKKKSKIKSDKTKPKISSNDISIDQKKCPAKRNKRIKPYTHNDFSYIPTNGTVKYDLFDMGINNKVYFIPSQYNNYHTIQIPDSEYDQIYFWVGNQYIYEVNTYFKDGKQKVGHRKKTLQFAAHVFCNLYPDITDHVLFLKLRDYVIKYFEQPSDIDNDFIKRLAKSTRAMNNHTDIGRKYFVLNPAFNHLNKSDKMKEVHKRMSEFMRYYILFNHDSSLTLKELAVKMKLHPKTVKKYLDTEGVCYLTDKKSDYNYQKFLEVYLIEENRGLSLRKLAELIGISKNTVGRYIERFKKMMYDQK